MRLRTAVRDGLCLNWALPREALPPLEPPLRYDAVRWRDADWVFASALLFRLGGAPLGSLSLGSYPQFWLRLCAVDGEDLPSYWLDCVLTPSWTLPGVRWLARRPAVPARFDYPPTGLPHGIAGCRWVVQRHGTLAVAAREGAPAAGVGPQLGAWQGTLAYFQRRSRTYFGGRDGLRRIDIAPSRRPTAPLKVELEASDLLCECLDGRREAWPPLHSAWFWPEEAYLGEPDSAQAAVARRAPAPC